MKFDEQQNNLFQFYECALMNLIISINFKSLMNSITFSKMMNLLILIKKNKSDFDKFDKFRRD